MGVDEYFTKPVKLRILAAKIQTLLTGVRSQESGVRNQELKVSCCMAFTVDYSVSYSSAYRYIRY